MTKTSGNVFCTYSFHDEMHNDDDNIYLIDEKKISGLAQTTTSETISIEKQDGFTGIKAGKSEYIKFAERPLIEFPLEPDPAPESIAQLSTEVLYYIKSAGQYISQEQLINPGSFVHVNAWGILGTDLHNIIYYKKYDDLPSLTLSAHALQVIDAKAPCTYSRNGNYDFFDYGEFRFGVIAGHKVAGIDPSRAFNGESSKCFTVARQSLLDFCIMAGYAIEKSISIGKIKYDSHVLDISISDVAQNSEVRKEIICDHNGDACPEFGFDLRKLNHFLKHLPYSILTWHRAGPHFWITSDEDKDFRAFFAGLKA